MCCVHVLSVRTIVTFQIYALRKTSDEYDISTGPIGTTNSKETIIQLKQELEELQREKMEVS